MSEYSIDILGDNGEVETFELPFTLFQLIQMTSEERDFYKTIVTERKLYVKPKREKNVIVKIVKCSQKKGWYNDVRGVFESLPIAEHHQGLKHGYIYDLIATKRAKGWVYSDDVILLKNNLWNRFRARLNRL
jgi:hypothetical protein